jgi:hypothetical protein
MRIELKFRDNDARAVQCYLADRYGKKRSTKLETLVMIAIRREVAEQAKKELKAMGMEFDNLER